MSKRCPVVILAPFLLNACLAFSYLPRVMFLRLQFNRAGTFISAYFRSLPGRPVALGGCPSGPDMATLFTCFPAMFTCPIRTGAASRRTVASVLTADRNRLCARSIRRWT